MKAVLDTKVLSAYDDDISTRYHFPSRYLTILTASVGDWVVFRQPRASGGNLAYFAVAYVKDVVPDALSPQHHYALISNYTPFDKPVPWVRQGRYAERALRELENVPQLGLYLRGKSVRPLEAGDFIDIVSSGLSESWGAVAAPANELGSVELDLLAARLEVMSAAQQERTIITRLINRKLRDRNFRRAVCAAYKGQCAVTGMSIVDRRGRYEVQGAHIVPVAEGGPDIVPNGIALSGTIHWLFDRHMLSIDAGNRLLAAPQLANSALKELCRHGAPIYLPGDPKHWPSQAFLDQHRRIFSSVHTDII